MLTNLEWMCEGRPFPPECEKERLARYKNNEKLFEGKHAEVFAGHFDKLEAYLKKRHMEPLTVFQYPQLLTRKTADFVCGEPVEVEAGGYTDALRSVLYEAGFDVLLYEAMLDISRFGDAPIKLMQGRAASVAPECWFPVVDETDRKCVTHHVLAYPVGMDKEGKYRKIYVEIHAKGQAETRVYHAKYDKSSGQLQFGSLIEQESVKPYRTNIDGFGICVLKNISHSKSVYGMDDYNAISSLVEKIMWRVHCIDQVLDKHSEPSLSGPASALSYDERTGMHYLDLGNYFKRSHNDDARVEYLTWDGDLQSSFRELEFLVNQLYIVSEMGVAFMDGGGQGMAASGTALKLRMTSPRIKAKRIAGINEQVVKRLIGLLGNLGGVDVKQKDISLTWHDGLPNDPKEEVEVLMAANGGLPVESHFSTVKRWNGVDDGAAWQIVKEMQESEKI